MIAALAETTDDISTTSNGPSTARAEASRANGSRSHGPTSVEGKERSRRNGCKEGLTGAGIVLPPDAAEEVARREAGFTHDLRPRNPIERELVRQMALGAWRSEVLTMRIIQHEARMNAARFNNWEADEQLAAAEIGRRLGDDAEVTVARLRRSSAGCGWLIERWTLLGNGLTCAEEGGAGCNWTDADLALALDLMGRPPELRHLDARAKLLESLCAQARSGSDEAVTELREIIAEEVADLEERNEMAWEGVEQPRLQNWRSGFDIDPGPEGVRLWRYEAAADRLFRSAWNKLERIRKERGEPLMPRCERGFAAEPAARREPPAVPRCQPVPPAPAPVRSVPDVSRSSLLGDPAAPVLDFWVGGPPRPAINLGGLLPNKTNPTPSRPTSGGRAARRGNQS